jgi:predicted RNase H-like HicB family nuclease
MVTNQYAAIIERAGSTFSVFFPDLPGCTSAGRTVDEAAINAEEALAAHILQCADLPEPTSLLDIENDPEVNEVARLLVSLPGN